MGAGKQRFSYFFIQTCTGTAQLCSFELNDGPHLIDPLLTSTAPCRLRIRLTESLPGVRPTATPAQHEQDFFKLCAHRGSLDFFSTKVLVLVYISVRSHV